MSGINYGYKYTLGKATRDAKLMQKGVFFSELSNKWMVILENKNLASKKSRPFICVAQFEEKEEANQYFDKKK